MSITQIPTTNFWKNRSGYKPKWLILHGTAGGRHAKDIAQQFINSQGTSEPKSVHYVVDQQGVVVQCVQEKDAAWGNGVWETGADPWWSTALNPNLVTISIEHVKNDVNNASALTTAQQTASFALIRDICQRNGIPMRKADKNGGITGHFSISPVDRAHCPGVFPWQDLFTFLKGPDMLQISDAFAATYFKEVATNPARWQCNNGFAVLGAILDFYRKTSGAARLPKSNEQYVIPGVVWQQFESGIIVYDPENKLDSFHSPFPPCYMVKLDSDLAKQILSNGGPNLQPALDAANAALASERSTNATLQASLSKAQSDANAATTAAAKATADKNAAQTAVATAEAQVAELQKQLAAKPDKAVIASDLAAAIQAALAKL